jgi:hypothetical protein
VRPIQISRVAAASDPSLVWNAFVNLCFSGDPDLTPAQRVAQQAMRYDAEVLNGGHFQYFENQGLPAAREAVLALGQLGARRQRETLESAIRTHERVNPREERVHSREQFVKGALEGQYDQFDEDYEASPLDEPLKAWLHSHFDEFIEWID